MDDQYVKKTIFFLRIGIGALFAYFGMYAIIDPASQLYWFADWIPGFIKTIPLITIFGILQVCIALSLLIGKFIRYSSALAGILLIGITINLGFNEIAYRDLVLALASFVLAAYDYEKHKK